MVKTDVFHNGHLRKICRVFRPDKNITWKFTRLQAAVLEIKLQWLRWLGHVLRMCKDGMTIHTEVALRWTPPRRREWGRPKTIWRKTVKAEIEDMALSWGGGVVCMWVCVIVCKSTGLYAGSHFGSHTSRNRTNSERCEWYLKPGTWLGGDIIIFL